MRTRVQMAVGALLIGSVVGPVAAQDSRWGSPEEATVKAIIAVEKMWAESSCAPQPGLQDVIAEDFQGTSTRGARYGKADAITTDTTALARECELGEVKVRFFGADVAIAYGSESRLRKDQAGHEAKRCQVWTDTWLRRQGKWQIVAAQDGVVDCK